MPDQPNRSAAPKASRHEAHEALQRAMRRSDELGAAAGTEGGALAATLLDAGIDLDIDGLQDQLSLKAHRIGPDLVKHALSIGASPTTLAVTAFQVGMATGVGMGVLLAADIDRGRTDVSRGADS